MPIDLIKSMRTRNLKRSKHFLHCLSYFLGYKKFLTTLIAFKAKDLHSRLMVKTVGIGAFCKEECSGYNLIKLKSSPADLHKTIVIINNNKNISFIVDFNGSLTFKYLTFFINNISTKNLFAIEQPLQALEKIPNMSCLAIADETFVQKGYNNLQNYGYNGFIFKPFAHNITTLATCYENKNKYFGMVGSNIAGPLDISWCNYINNYMPIKLVECTTSAFYNHPLNDQIKNLIQINGDNLQFSDSLFDYLTNYCQKISDELFDMYELKAICSFN